MLSERERRTLAHIEHALVQSDPELAQLFARAHQRRRSGLTMPTFLLMTGVGLMVLGSLLVTVSVAITGMAFALTALTVAYFRPDPRVFPSAA